MKIEVQIVKEDKTFNVTLVGHKNTAHVTSKREVLSSIGEMMDSKCAEGTCNCSKLK